MTLIRIVSGCYAAHPNGGRLKVIDKGQTVEVSEDEAARLVNLGVAAYVKEAGQPLCARFGGCHERHPGRGSERGS